MKVFVLEQGQEWLRDDPQKKDMLVWISGAPLGERFHRNEELWLILLDREGPYVLLANYEQQCREAVQLIYPVSVDLHSMD